ncbi:MAG: hypothetical protein CVU55_05215 [Deltaproteobacteria bacterium HGW-Deltaproteobacteria-13]|jgi:hypothetical protein|nr:MAG: hypothetical protein CVU55_05215 [Deltaproteobacteria bacterium HGW-Deltaproteobacteria-13]
MKRKVVDFEKMNLLGMKKKSIVFVLLLLIFPLFSCSTFISEKYTAEVPRGQCLPVFPDKDGWYGGDGAYSIKLDQERTLWLFGDTFVDREEGRKDRVDMDFVAGTTLAVSTCSANNEFNIKYYLKKKNGEFASSFGENEWLWPQDPFKVNDVLYIPLIVVTPTNKEGELFNFKITGHKFVRIKDFSAADPNKWNYDYIDLTPAISPDIRAFASTSVVYKNDVYFYPFYAYSKDQVNILGNILARIPASRIDNPAGAVEYFTKDGTWQNKLNPETVKVVLDASVSELSVRYHAAEKKWIAVYLSTQNKGDKLLYQAADKPEGPWTTPKTLGAPIPEVDPQSRLYDKNNFCYAGKEHIEYSRNRNLIVTYVCNSAEDSQNPTSFIRRNLFLYRPVVRAIGY